MQRRLARWLGAAVRALPDPLVCVDGTKVIDAKTWREKRRPELLKLFRDQVYGHRPELPKAPGKVVAVRDDWGGLATRKKVALRHD